MAIAKVKFAALLELAGYMKYEFNFNNRGQIKQLDDARWVIVKKFMKTKEGKVIKGDDGKPVLKDGREKKSFDAAIEGLMNQWVEIYV